MIRTSAQIAHTEAGVADQANSARQRTRHNARKHGFFADVFPSGEEMREDRAKYFELLAGLRDSIRPTDSFEDLQFQKLALLHVRLSRLYKADARIAPKMFTRVEEVLDKDPPEVTTQWINKEDEVIVPQKDPTAELLIRYETSLERQVARTLDRIEQWRRMRQGTPQSADAEG